jgi:branched-subunit amino acid ABC-type transport system permease component
VTITLVVIYQILFATSLFILISLGLAVIFGMMRVINLAQGEFIMLGAYSCLWLTTGLQFNFWIAALLSGVLVGIFGIIVERCMIRFLYGRIMDTLLATWGLSLLMIGLVTTIFGPQEAGVEVHMGKIDFGEFSIAIYNLVLIATAAILLMLTYLLWKHTKFGLVVRGTMQNPQMSGALGINTDLYYMLTFGFGSAITGFAGALIAPLVGSQPTMGSFYVAKAFITVISGGSAPLSGTFFASTIYGATDGIISFATTQVVGEICMLIMAIVLLRLLPSGITGRFGRGV